MKNKTFAAIDIGSNAARLLIKTADPLETAVSGILKKQLLCVCHCVSALTCSPKGRFPRRRPTIW